MVYFQTKNRNLGEFWRAFQWKMCVYFMVYFTSIWYILWPFGIFCSNLVYFPCVGKLYQEKSGNPGHAFEKVDKDERSSQRDQKCFGKGSKKIQKSSNSESCLKNSLKCFKHWKYDEQMSKCCWYLKNLCHKNFPNGTIWSHCLGCKRHATTQGRVVHTNMALHLVRLQDKSHRFSPNFGAVTFSAESWRIFRTVARGAGGKLTGSC
jgi:hypothetical protein